jgi:plastocyanin
MRDEINRDDVPHTVVSADKQTMVSPALDADEKFSYTFTTAGTNGYFCSVHPHMKGRVIVQQGSGSPVFDREAR